ncbi:CAP domain-containing protein [Acidicapsa acidisoli]|uniref:CAP domain-containing protein n=1 Tax=Acidicapsa acidisoli TaxID=1615681 RepID=UPI0021DF5947|nr:CAP domain-containing protein [Acidicapsa acidisoli]
MSFDRRSRLWIALMLTIVLSAAAAMAQNTDERRLVDLTNEARAQAGLKPVVWDANLAAAAHAHAVLMAEQGQISHRYSGEADLPERAASAGAHFSVIAENIAGGTSPEQIHGAWMVSRLHHDNLMNVNIDHIGVALIAARGTLYAVVDFTKSVQSLTSAQVEATVGKIITDKGLTLLSDASGARQYCALDDGASGAGLGLKARSLMRWQSADISKLPPQLDRLLAGGQFKQAAVGACEPKGSGTVAGGPIFSGYRVAVLLY